MGGGEPEKIEPIRLPWRHRSWLRSYDWHSIRRGKQVFQDVFAPCHSLNNMYFRHFSVFMTDKEVKEFAKSFEVLDPIPNAEGEHEKRPGKPTDLIPKPYKNEKEARFSNNGALPLDLTSMVNAKAGGCDYIFCLMTSFHRPPPAGVELDAGVHWNPYFYGGKIGMPPPLSDGIVEYEDGTESSVAQMAKDVTNFLAWTADPHMDKKKVTWMKCEATLVVLSATWWYYFKYMKNNWLSSKQSAFRAPLKYVKPV